MDQINELLLQKRYTDVFSCIYNLMEEKQETKELYPVLFQLAKLGYHFQVYDILDNLSIDDKTEKRIIENEIKNQQKICLLNDFQKDVYEDAIWRISSEIKNGEYLSAYMYASYAYSITKIPEFLYYQGKALFRIRDEFNARKVFLEYIEIGSERVNKAYTYLLSISKKFYDEAMIDYCRKEMEEIDYLYRSDFKYQDYGYCLNFPKKDC